MVQRAAMTQANPNLSYRSAIAPEAGTSGVASVASDGVADSHAAPRPDFLLPDTTGRRFSGWMCLAIIGAGAILSWALLAAMFGWLR